MSARIHCTSSRSTRWRTRPKACCSRGKGPWWCVPRERSAERSHELLVHGKRTGELRVKATEDLDPAASLLSWFLDHEPRSLIEARQDLAARGKGRTSRLAMGARALDRRHPGPWGRVLAL